MTEPTQFCLSFSFFSFLSLALHSSCFSVIPKTECFLLLIYSVPTLQSTCKSKNNFLTEFSLAVFSSSHFRLSHMHLALENSFLLISCILPSSFVSILIWCKCSLKWKKLLLAGISLLPFYFYFFGITTMECLCFMKFLFKKLIKFWAWIGKWNYLHSV